MLIIALNSTLGFLADAKLHKVDWKFLLPITAIAITGVLICGLLNKKTETKKLKKGFGWFVSIMGIYIIVKEVVF